MTTILIVDDEPAHRMLAKRAIVQSLPAVEIREAGSVPAASEALQKDPFSLAVLDLNLGGESALVILKMLRAEKSFEELPVIILSTSAMESDIRASYTAGANCYLTKSSNPHEYQSNLAAAVAFFLRRDGAR